MKRRVSYIIIISAVVLMAGLIAYSVMQKRLHTEQTGKIRVVTTFTVLADMARNVAGDTATVESLTKPGAEIHGYEPTPRDVARLKGATVVLDNGLGLEKWAEKLYQNVPNVPHVTLTAGITPIAISEGPYQNAPNPHAWMSPANALIYVDNIEKALSTYDPTHTATYKRNAERYKKQIDTLNQTLKSEIQTLKASQRYLVTCEGAFTYLTRDYGLIEQYLWPINADAQGTPQQIRSVIESVNKDNIPVVFCESTVNPKAQEQVARETGARYGGAFYVDSLSGPTGPTPTYLALLQYNIDTFLREMKR